MSANLITESRLHPEATRVNMFIEWRLRISVFICFVLSSLCWVLLLWKIRPIQIQPLPAWRLSGFSAADCANISARGVAMAVSSPLVSENDVRAFIEEYFKAWEGT